jgi:Na+/serine symporter
VPSLAHGLYHSHHHHKMLLLLLVVVVVVIILIIAAPVSFWSDNNQPFERTGCAVKSSWTVPFSSSSAAAAAGSSSSSSNNNSRSSSVSIETRPSWGVTVTINLLRGCGVCQQERNKKKTHHYSTSNDCPTIMKLVVTI